MPPAISFKDVSFTYQDVPVLKDISLDVEEGQFLGVIGPNGGGKTTFLKLIMAFLRPQNGTVLIFGQPPQVSVQTVSYVPQNLRFDKDFPISVIEIVLGGRLAHLPWYGIFRQADKDAALYALEQVGMQDFQQRAFGSLSGGQAQRVLIARALASEPRLLLLDEPTASVDVSAEADIYAILRKLQGKMTILMVTHNLQATIELVEKVVCIQQTLTTLDPRQVCEHFALGLYHAPLINLQKGSS